MFRLWAREWKNQRVIADTVVEDPSQDTRTHKVFRAVDTVCERFNLARPIWLDSCVRDFQRRSRARFTQDCFVETLEFDYLEIQIIEED